MCARLFDKRGNTVVCGWHDSRGSAAAVHKVRLQRGLKAETNVCRRKPSCGRDKVVVICGKNAAVKRELEETEWPSNSRVIVKGFVSNMDEWMGAVDALVTKAGPGTIAEATIRCVQRQHQQQYQSPMLSFHES